MRHGSLFSGIGGFDLAAEWMGWENVFQVEWDAYCQKVLTKNFPNVKRYGDIREFDGTVYAGAVDIISGGFPCQPFSHAGKRKGTADDRYLWPEMLRVIREVKPSFVVGENVAGLVSMENGKILDRILSDLADEGYQTEQFIIPAASVGMCHNRDRIWIFAYTSVNAITFKNGKSFKNKKQRSSINDTIRGRQLQTIQSNGLDDILWTVTNTNNKRLERGKNAGNTTEERKKSHEQFAGLFCAEWEKYSGQSIIYRRDDGLPVALDGFKLSRKQHLDNRIKGLGNAIVPQVVFELFKAIEHLNENILSLSQKYV